MKAPNERNEQRKEKWKSNHRKAYGQYASIPTRFMEIEGIETTACQKRFDEYKNKKEKKRRRNANNSNSEMAKAMRENLSCAHSTRCVLCG